MGKISKVTYEDTVKTCTIFLRLLTNLLVCVSLFAETDDSKAIVSYIQEYSKTPSKPLPDKLKSKQNDIIFLKEFFNNSTLSLDKIPAEIIEKSKDLIFREAFIALARARKLKIVSDDKTITAIIQKFNEQDVYTYLLAKINFLLVNNEAFLATLKNASQEVKDFTLLELMLNTASQFDTTKDYRKTDGFINNKILIELAIKAGGKINGVINKIPELGLSATQQESFINSLFAPHFDYFEFLVKNGLDKNLFLPTLADQKKRNLLELYESQLKTITQKLVTAVSSELKNTQSECQKIIALIKNQDIKPNIPTAPQTETGLASSAGLPAPSTVNVPVGAVPATAVPATAVPAAAVSAAIGTSELTAPTEPVVKK